MVGPTNLMVNLKLDCMKMYKRCKCIISLSGTENWGHRLNASGATNANKQAFDKGHKNQLPPSMPFTLPTS
jgi:hypothetical protein